MKKIEEVTQTGIPENASITNPPGQFVRLRGSHSPQQAIQAVARPLRRREDDNVVSCFARYRC